MEQNIIAVSQVNEYIKFLLDRDELLGNICVRGGRPRERDDPRQLQQRQPDGPRGTNTGGCDMSAKSKTFEASMERLETIVRQLEQGNVPLEESLKLFQEGTALVQSCTKLLDGAETEIVKLMKTADGTPAETEYVRDE